MRKEILEKALITNQYSFSAHQIDQFYQYLELLEKWNKTYNLTAISDWKEMVFLHILDSLSVGPYLHGIRIIDVGTGAGLPGIPLAIFHPEKEFVLLDSNSKKTRFLTHVKQVLKLSNVEIVHARCEVFKSENCFDTIISRAFAAIQVMLTLTSHLLCKNGKFLAMKGVYPQQEIQTISPDFTVQGVHSLNINGLNAERCVVICEKNRS